MLLYFYLSTDDDYSHHLGIRVIGDKYAAPTPTQYHLPMTIHHMIKYLIFIKLVRLPQRLNSEFQYQRTWLRRGTSRMLTATQFSE